MVQKVAELQAEITVSTSNLDRQLDRTNASLQQTRRVMESSVAGASQMSRASDQVRASTQRLGQVAQEAAVRTRSLQQTLRDNVVSLTDNNIAAIALGTTIGALVAQGLARMVTAVADATQQFSELHNQLVLTQGVSARAGEAMALIEEVARNSTSSVRELTQRFQQLVGEYRGSNVTFDQVKESFRAQEQAISALQMVTLGGSMSRLLDETGRLVIEFDKLLGISRFIQGILNAGAALIRAMAEGAKQLQNIMGGPKGPFEGLNLQARATNELLTTRRDLEKQIFDIQMNSIVRLPRLTEQVQDEAGIRRRILEITTELERRGAEKALQDEIENRVRSQIVEQLQLETSLARASTVQQEMKNRLLQIELQFRQAGLDNERAAEAARALSGQVAGAVLAGELQGMREQLLSRELLEQESFARRMEMLQGFYAAGLTSTAEHNAMMETEMARSTYAIQKIELERNAAYLTAFTQTGQYAQELLQMLGQKSKVAAVAAVVVGKGLAIATTIQQGTAASMAALAPPPIGLGPVAGAPLSAAIKALTAVNVGIIAATGALQVGAALGGGGAPSVGGPSNTAPNIQEQGSMPTRIVIEPVDPAMIFTGDQLNQLIENINERARSGHVVIASSVLP